MIRIMGWVCWFMGLYLLVYKKDSSVAFWLAMGFAGMAIILFLISGKRKRSSSIVSGSRSADVGEYKVEFKDEICQISGSFANDSFDIAIKSPLSYSLLKEAILGFNSHNFLSAIITAHLSVEHAIIAKLRMVYSKATPDDKEIPKLFKDKLSKLVDIDPRYEPVMESAMILWNISRITYVHPIADTDEYAKFKKEYQENEHNLLMGAETIAVDAIQRAVDIHILLGN